MSTQTKIDVYDIVTNRIIELLEAGTIPWQKPWAEAGIPMNLISKRPYKGINVWLLTSLDYVQNLFLTFDQLKSIGGSVKKDEKGQVVVFWKSIKKQPEELDEQGNPKMIPMLRYYKVFNIAQCRDIPANLLLEKVERDIDPIAECEAIVSGTPECPAIRHKEQKAYYDVEQDYINMPKKKSFKSSEGYYQTLFHELIHSTGHQKRLNRKSITEMAEFTDDLYSLEELVAELGACYLASFSGILKEEISNSAAYIKGWLKKLRDDKKMIVHAASFAQKGVDFILNSSKGEDIPKGESCSSKLAGQ